MKVKQKKIFCLVIGILFLISFRVQAAVNPVMNFVVETDYDRYGRTQIEGKLIKTTNKFYIYADKEWWNNLSFPQQSSLQNRLYNLSTEFEYKIYPQLTQFYGPFTDLSWENGRLFLVLEPLKTGIGGYVKTKYPYTIYLSANNLNTAPDNLIYYEVAHEFTHLLTFKLKPNEDIWLNELRAEYAETLLGYNNNFEQSNLKQRIKDLSLGTEFNLLRWDNSRFNYATINLLGHYLVEQFGKKILADSLHAPYTGIESLNYALKKEGYSEDFGQVLQNWLIALVLNDCSFGSQYCYKRKNFQNLVITPYSYYLPTTGHSSLSVTDSLLPWSAKWLRFTGGKDLLKIKWNIKEDTPIIRIPYIIIRSEGKKKLGFFDFSTVNESEIYVPDFGEKNISLIVIPSLTQTAGAYRRYFYSFEVITTPNNSANQEKIIQELLQKIAYLKQQIALLRAQLATLRAQTQCSFFWGDLHYGLRSPEVACLQQFLKKQGREIYPEGLVTGYYGPLTLKAVQRFQAKYNLPSTGYFGPLTRATVNQLLGL